MNLVAIDIGNTNINIALFLADQQESVEPVPIGELDAVKNKLREMWERIPPAKGSTEHKPEGVIVACSVKPDFTPVLEKMVKEVLNENVLLVGREVPFPIDLSIDEPEKVGVDRVVAAAAAYAVIENAVVLADFGTAVTIDIVDEKGIFLGGVICPGFQAGSKALHESTAQLPLVSVGKPELPWGRNTKEAIKCGLYYSAIGTLGEVIKRYSEKIGRWPKTIITGAGAKIIKDDCPFIDSYVPNLVVKGIALSYRRYLEEKI